MSALDVALLINARERMEQDIDVTQLLFDIAIACNNTCTNAYPSAPSTAESSLSLSAFPFVEWPSASVVEVSASAALPATTVLTAVNHSADASSPHSSSQALSSIAVTSALHSPYGRQCLNRCVHRLVYSHLSSRVRSEQTVARLVAEQREQIRHSQVKRSGVGS